MKAIVQQGYGSPERVLQLEDVEQPAPAEHEVLVRVRSSSINAGDWRRVYASPFFIRLMGGVRRPSERELGGDVAGVVEAVGPGGSDLEVGDEVYGIRHGALADYVAGQNFVRKPHNLSFDQAAAVPIAGVTAIQALQKHGNIQPGERVAIHGAGGGVGTFAVQLAKAFGAQVTAVTSSDKGDLVRSLGADRVVDYTREDFTRGEERYDLIVEIGGNVPVRSMSRALAPGGRIIIVGAGRGRFGVISRIIGVTIRRRLGQPIKFFVANGPYQEQLETLRELIEAGKVRPAIERTYDLADVAQAIRHVATEKTRGKVVVTINP